jgi:hypothetical protein
VNAHKFNQWHPVSAPLPLAEKQALALRDLVVVVAKAKGVSLSTNQPGDLYTYHDARIRMEYSIVSSTFMIFLTKTLGKVAAEMALSVLAYNLTRVMNIVGTKPLIAAIVA